MAFHGRDLPTGQQARGFQADRTAAGPQVPENGVRGQAQQGKGQGAHGLLGHQAACVGQGGFVQAQFQGQGRGFEAFEQNHVRRLPVGVRGLVQGQRGQPFIGPAEIFGHMHAPARHSARQQEPGHGVGAMRAVRVQGRQAAVGQGREERGDIASAMQGERGAVVPGQAEAGAGGLQGRDVGVKDEFLRGEETQQARADAVEQRVAVGQHADGAGLGALADAGREIVQRGQGQPSILIDAQFVQHAFPPGHQVRRKDQRQRFGGAMGGAKAQAQDVDHAASGVA